MMGADNLFIAKILKETYSRQNNAPHQRCLHPSSWNLWLCSLCSKRGFKNKDFSYLLLQRGRKKERGRNIDVQEKHWSAAFHAPPSRDLAHNSDIYPGWELNLWLVGFQDDAQPTELHQSGHGKVDLADVIKGTDLEMGRQSWCSGWIQCYHKGPYKKEVVDSVKKRRKCDSGHRGEGGGKGMEEGEGRFWRCYIVGFEDEGRGHQARNVDSFPKLKKALASRAGVAQWIEYRPLNKRVAGLVPSQGTCLGCGPGP